MFWGHNVYFQNVLFQKNLENFLFDILKKAFQKNSDVLKVEIPTSK